VRTCVIFNPAAKGQKAERFRTLLTQISSECSLIQTTIAGDARRLAAEVVREGFESVIAAGGDGTLNEVLNGIGDVENGFKLARLGVLPLGTVNVFARELGIPTKPEAAWEILKCGNERVIDLGFIENGDSDERKRFYFAQLAGAGLDARAIELVSWSLKKQVGPLAYIDAGMKALDEQQSAIVVSDGVRSVSGELVLVGNGKLYGGNFRMFPDSRLDDGKLHVCVFPKANWFTLFKCGFPLVLAGKLAESAVIRMSGTSFTFIGQPKTRYQVDGEMGGSLPARIRVLPSALRVLCP
jgi:YegS/Rv2252/BmrU family lipid kinase